jgi:hypothetical protein
LRELASSWSTIDEYKDPNEASYWPGIRCTNAINKQSLKGMLAMNAFCSTEEAEAEVPSLKFIPGRNTIIES